MFSLFDIQLFLCSSVTSKPLALFIWTICPLQSPFTIAAGTSEIVAHGLQIELFDYLVGGDIWHLRTYDEQTLIVQPFGVNTIAPVLLINFLQSTHIAVVMQKAAVHVDSRRNDWGATAAGAVVDIAIEVDDLAPNHIHKGRLKRSIFV